MEKANNFTGYCVFYVGSMFVFGFYMPDKRYFAQEFMLEGFQCRDAIHGISL